MISFQTYQKTQEHKAYGASMLRTSQIMGLSYNTVYIGRIGRGDYRLVEPYWLDQFRFACDEEPNVRLSFIWASENIATNTPDIYETHMQVFEKLLF